MPTWLIIVLILLLIAGGVVAYLHFTGKLSIGQLTSSTSSVPVPATV